MAFNPLVYLRAETVRGRVSGATLVAATPITHEYDVAGTNSLTFVISNTGSTNALTVSVQKSPTGLLYAEDVQVTQDIGTLAHGDSVLVEFFGMALEGLRLVLLSASGTTYSLDLKGVR